MQRITREQSHFYRLLDRSKLTSDQICARATAFTLTQDVDNPAWEIVDYYEDSPLDSNSNLLPMEYVYVLVNKSMPGMVKIGMTIRTVDERAAEISSATGVPTPWVPVFSFSCYRSRELEAEIHDHLRALRVSDNREMFHLHSTDAIEIVKRIGYPYTLPC